MRIEKNPPYVRRGVTQLMYVGDDDAVETATKPPVNWGKVAKIAGAVWIAMWVLSGISPDEPRRR